MKELNSDTYAMIFLGIVAVTLGFANLIAEFGWSFFSLRIPGFSAGLMIGIGTMVPFVALWRRRAIYRGWLFELVTGADLNKVSKI